MGVQNKAHQVIDFLGDAFNYGMKKAIKNDADRIANNAYHLTANDPINAIGKIGQTLMSPAAAIGGIARTGQIGASLKATYAPGVKKEILDAAGKGTGKFAYQSEYNLGNIAGSAFIGAVGMATLGGLTHDSSGNPDIAGIPGI